MTYKNTVGGSGGSPRYAHENAIITILKMREPRLTYELPSYISGHDINYDHLTKDAIKHNLAPELRFVLVNTLNLLQNHNVNYEKLEELKNSIVCLGESVDKRKPHIMINLDLPNLENILKDLQTKEEKESGVIGRLTYEGFKHTYLMNDGKGIHQQGSCRLS